MKKISIIMATAAVALGFASCSQDRDPVYQTPTSFVLNTPAMENQYIELTEGNTLELVCSQPDYGYSAVANYSAEMSLTEDFETFEAITPTNDHLARMTFKQEDIALGLCKLLNVASEDAFNEKYPDGMPFEKIYFRALCQLEGVGNSLIYSNVVSYNYVKGYMAVAVPGYIYLVGSPEGWAGPDEANAAHYAPWRLFEPDNAIGSKVYSATFDLPASPMFRFYTALTGWDADSYGTQEEDNPIDYPEFTGESSETLNLVKGKGSFNFPNFMGGTVTIVVNMSDPSNMTVELIPGAYTPTVTNYVYMVGNNGGWAEPVEGTYEDWKLADADGSGVYTATFDFADFTEAEGVLYCRFYQTLAGWDSPDQLGSAPEDGTNIEVASGVAAPVVPGKGCFTMPAAGHKIQVVLDTNQLEVTFTYVD